MPARGFISDLEGIELSLASPSEAGRVGVVVNFSTEIVKW